MFPLLRFTPLVKSPLFSVILSPISTKGFYADSHQRASFRQWKRMARHKAALLLLPWHLSGQVTDGHEQKASNKKDDFAQKAFADKGRGEAALSRDLAAPHLLQLRLRAFLALIPHPSRPLPHASLGIVDSSDFGRAEEKKGSRVNFKYIRERIGHDL